MKRFAIFVLTALLCFGMIGAVSFADAIQVPSPVEIPDGAVGVWQVPKLKTSSPLYERKEGKTAQDIVDDYNCALINYYGVGRMIHDHYGSRIGNNKNLWTLEKLNVDDIAWFITEDEITKYVCYMVCVADYAVTCYKIDGVPIWPHYSSDIICSCCVHDDTAHVYLAFFRYVGVWG